MTISNEEKRIRTMINEQSNLAATTLLLEKLFRTGSNGYGIGEFLFFFIPLFCIGIIAFVVAISLAKIKKNSQAQTSPKKQVISNMGKDANKITGAILILAGYHGAAAHAWLETAGCFTIIIGVITLISGFTGERTP